MPLSKTNLAQKDDITAFLAVVKALHDVGIHCPIMYPHSRGGAVVMKSIGILNDSAKKDYTELECTEEDKKAILGGLKIVYFNTPLKDTRLALQKKCEAKLAMLTWLFPSVKQFVSNNITNFIEKKILPTITCYDPNDTIQAMDYFNSWTNLDITTILHFQHGDKDVPGDDNVECAKKLLTVNPDNTYIIPGNDGGHEAGDKTLKLIIHALNESKGLSYLQDAHLTTTGNIILAENKPTLETVKQHLNNASKKYTQENTLKKIALYKKISLYSLAACCFALLVHICPATS